MTHKYPIINDAQHPKECAALIAIYEQCNGEDWRIKDGWLEHPNVAEWHGITCDDNGYVTGISLIGKQLEDDLPPEIGCFMNLQLLELTSNNLTRLPAEIGQLSELKALFLSYNHLSEIPREIGQLTNLGLLNLAHNPLTSLPAEIGNLANLVILNIECYPGVWMTNYEGQITRLPREIGNLSKLRELWIEGHPLTCIPEGVAHLVDDLSVCEE